MNFIVTTATAVEKLNRAGKARRSVTGTSLAQALDAVAVEAGYNSWKHVTVCAGMTARTRQTLLPADHLHRVYQSNRRGRPNFDFKHSVAELCDALGGIQPVFIRQACSEGSVAGQCLCQVDPFATAKRANALLDIGDKYDTWHYLFDVNRPYQRHGDWEIRRCLRLPEGFLYPGHGASLANDDRSNSLNPNNEAHGSARDNRANQLNPNNFRFEV